MTNRSRLLATTVIAGILLAFVFTAACAAGVRWTPNGVQVSASVAAEHVGVVPDGLGGSYQVFTTSPSSVYDVKIMRLNSSGSNVWVSPVSVRNTDGPISGPVDNPVAVADGAGGVVVVWEDGRATKSDIYASRVMLNGTRAAGWTTAGGKPIRTSGANSATNPSVIADGLGGFIIGWQEVREPLTYSGIYAIKLLGNGDTGPGWTPGGEIVSGAYGAVDASICADGAGGAFFAWTDWRHHAANEEIWAQRMTVLGTRAWAAGAGIGVKTNYDTAVNHPRIISDDANGCIVGWFDWRNTFANIYAERLSADGALVTGWTADGNGVRVLAEGSAYKGSGSKLSLVSDGDSGAIFGWTDNRAAAGYKLYSQRLLDNGEADWTANGVCLAPASADANACQGISDGDGGAVFTWLDARATDTQVFAQRVLPGGTVAAGWDASGFVVRDTGPAGDPSAPAIAADGYGGSIVSWLDSRNGDSDVYSQRVSNPAPVVMVVAPTSGTNDGAITLLLGGTNFSDVGGPPSVILRKAGQSDEAGTAETVINSQIVTCNMDLTGLALGEWDVLITNSDGQSGGMVGAFTIEAGVPAVDSVDPAEGKPGQQVTVWGTRFLPARGTGYVTINDLRVDQYISWSDSQIRLEVPAGATSGPVVVHTLGGASNADVTFSLVYPTWYLAEGSTAWGFDTYITIENPAGVAKNAKVTFMKSDGGTVERTVGLPAASQTTIDPRQDVPSGDFSAKVECLQGSTIAVDRTMEWTAGGRRACHASVAVALPAKTWFLPEGSSAWGFEAWLCIQNPNPSAATCKLTYMIEGQGPKVVEKTLAANSRATYSMKDDIGEKDASVKVESSLPVIPERSMYRNARKEGHESNGATTPAEDYFLAEGTTAWGFTTYVLVQNPQPSETEVTLTYMTSEGAKPQAAFTMPANSRKTVRVNDALPNADMSIKVNGSQPIIAERAMYWDNGTGEACHDSIGVAGAHPFWYLPDGQTSDGWETFVLVQNPNAGAVDITVTYLLAGGAGNVTVNRTIPGSSRLTFNMYDSVESDRASVVVQSNTAHKGIIVERAMYVGNRGEGTGALGAFAD